MISHDSKVIEASVKLVELWNLQEIRPDLESCPHFESLIQEAKKELMKAVYHYS